MSLLLYAITDSEAPPAPALGVDARPVHRVSADGLAALVSEHDSTPKLDEDSAWKFERVVEAQMHAGATLPMRYGSVVPDTAAVARLLSQRRQELLDQLARVRGAVELSIAARWRSDPEPESAAVADPGAEAAGTAYMLERVEIQRRARELEQELQLRLDPLARATRYDLLPRPGKVLTAALLVDRDRAAGVVDQVQALATAIVDVELTCTGPWPPYSFVGGEGQ